MPEPTNQELIEQLKNTKSVEVSQPSKPKKFSIKTLILLAILVGALLVTSYAYQSLGYNVISKETIHWHARIKITDHGKDVTIPAGIGLAQTTDHPETLHTHEGDGVIHMEIQGPVHARQIMLVRFFEAWGRDFGEPKNMQVNGISNFDLGQYVMYDGDKIELLY